MTSKDKTSTFERVLNTVRNSCTVGQKAISARVLQRFLMILVVGCVGTWATSVAVGHVNESQTIRAIVGNSQEETTAQEDAAEQENEKPTSIWRGVMEAGGRKFEFQFRYYESEDGKDRLLMDSLSEKIEGIPGTFEMDSEGQITLDFPTVKGKFSGTLNEARDQVKGEWEQGGGSFPLTLDKVDALKKDEPTTVWLGTLDAGLQKLELQFRYYKSDEGEDQVLMDSLSQKVNGISGTYAKDDEGEITFEFPAIRAKFIGTLNDSGDQLSGHWNQGGGSLPLTLDKVESTKSAESVQPKRPQMPKGPFPYQINEVAIHNEADDVTLAGTLTIPEGDGPFPAAILISGSGPQDRDETLLGHKPFWVIADALSRQGIAVLRFDDRGVGKSTGDFSSATTEDFSRDAEACFEYLRENESIYKDGIGLIGHSEGGLVGPMTAARNHDIAYVVMLAGPGVDGFDIVTSQSRLILEAGGTPKERVDTEVETLIEILDLVSSSDEDADLRPQFEEIVDRVIAGLTEEEQKAAKENRDLSLQSFEQFRTPWFRFFLEYDPAPALQQLDCPVLALIGEKDLQVPADVNIKAIKEALAKGENDDHQVIKLEGLNHLFQHAGTGSPTEYQGIEETFDPETLKLISNWINERFGQ